MTTTAWVKSKCPNCGKEYEYEEVTSCTIYGNSLDIFLKSLFDAYIKDCDCGTQFNMNDYRIDPVRDFITSALKSYDAERLSAIIKGFDDSDEKDIL